MISRNRRMIQETSFLCHVRFLTCLITTFIITVETDNLGLNHRLKDHFSAFDIKVYMDINLWRDVINDVRPTRLRAAHFEHVAFQFEVPNFSLEKARPTIDFTNSVPAMKSTPGLFQPKLVALQ